MGARGKPCRSCSHPDAEELNKRIIREQDTFSTLSDRYGISVEALKRHKRFCLQPKLAVAMGDRPPGPEMPKLEGLSPQDHASAHCEWLRLRIEWAQKAGLPEKDVAQLAGQYTNAQRLYARLSGALELTEAQIVKSAPWAKLSVLIRDALKGHPAALRDVVGALERYESGESK